MDIKLFYNEKKNDLKKLSQFMHTCFWLYGGF